MGSSRRLSLVTVALTGALIAGAAPAAAAGKLLGDYRLKGDLENRITSPLAMAPRGEIAFGESDVRGTIRTVLQFDEGEGVRVTGVPKAARSGYTIEVLLNYDDLEGYRRILSFGPNNIDKGLYFDEAYIDLYDNRESDDVVGVAGEWTAVRVTRDAATDRMRVYVDGVVVARFRDSRDEYLLRKGVVVFFQDDANAEHPSGEAARIRIWKGVVAPAP